MPARVLVPRRVAMCSLAPLGLCLAASLAPACKRHEPAPAPPALAVVAAAVKHEDRAFPNLPPRARGAETGSAFLARTASLDPDAFEAAIFDAIASGDVPPFERAPIEIELKGPGKSGAEHVVQLEVTPDYLAIGSDEDFVRIPMRPATAQRIANLTLGSLPTTRIVDAIDRQAEVKLYPRAMDLSPTRMEERGAIGRHQEVVEEQRRAAHARLGALVSGPKKDIVISNQLAQRPDRVAIYGWHAKGTPIQPLSTLHESTYADYSHGVRLVSLEARVDGHAMRLADLLQDAELAQVVSEEGPMLLTAYP